MKGLGFIQPSTKADKVIAIFEKGECVSPVSAFKGKLNPKQVLAALDELFTLGLITKGKPYKLTRLGKAYTLDKRNKTKADA